MPWANLDDQFPKHPKIVGLSDAAFRLHVSGICYCAQYSTDGLVQADAVRLLVPRYKPRSLEELIERGLWIPLLDGKAFEIHDYLQWNRSRDEVETERERLRKVRSAAGKKGAKARWQNG